MMTLTFDQNALRDAVLIRYLGLSDLGIAEPADLELGAVCRLVDEDGDSYIATILQRDGDRFEFFVDVDSLSPKITVDLDKAVEAEKVSGLMEALRASFIGQHAAEPNDRSVPEPNIKRPVVTRVA